MAKAMIKSPAQTEKQLGSLLVGTGLTMASLILLPALAQRVGMGTALTGALRVALMKASSRV